MQSPGQTPSAEDPAIDAYLDSSPAPWHRRFDRRALTFAALGLGVYLLALLVTIPARLAVPLAGADGTIWHGSAPLDGDTRLIWRWAPLRSLYRFGFAADFTVTGPDTRLAGQALLRPGRVSLDDVAGDADAALFQYLARPSFTCVARMRVAIVHAAIGGGDQGGAGSIRSEAGSCQGFGSAPVAVPALQFDLHQTPGLAIFNLAAVGRLRTPLMSGGLGADGKLRVIVSPDGAAAFPFASPRGGMKIETEL